MSDFYMGEIRMFSYPRAPLGWALCDGSVLQVNQNQALYSLIGNTYGGTAPTTFALPDLRGRTPIGSLPPTNPPATPYGGVETVSLTSSQMPAHNHLFIVKNAAATVTEPNDVLAIPTAAGLQVNIYNPSIDTSATLYPDTISGVGAGGAHENMQPFLTVNYCIAVTGFYPTRPY